MVELSAPARNGDSGGPIFNSRGELAGVLFGTAGGETAGSYSGRVRWFLTPVINDFQRLQPDGALLAAATSGPSNQSGTLAAAARTPGPARPAPLASIHAGPTRIGPDIPGTGPALVPSSSIQAESPAGMAQVPESGIPVAIPAPAGDAGQQAPSEDGFWEQVKNVLAAVGAVAILFHALRLLVVTPAPQPKGKKDSSWGPGFRVRGSGVNLEPWAMCRMTKDQASMTKVQGLMANPGVCPLVIRPWSLGLFSQPRTPNPEP
jgi:hypothetical protein